jgi:hypothetical protein
MSCFLRQTIIVEIKGGKDMQNHLIDGIRFIIEETYPQKHITEIQDRGVWFKQIFKITFSDHSAAYVKLKRHEDWDITAEAHAASLLRENKIDQPEIIRIGTACSAFPFDYGVYEDAPGVKLSAFLKENNKGVVQEVYAALGRYYKRYAELSGPFAGVWDRSPNRSKYALHPAEAMLKLEIVGGSGKALLENGTISRTMYEAAVRIWNCFLPRLMALPVHRTHFSPFPWSIYLDRNESGFFISKITALQDILWWNEHATLAHILFPPCFHLSDETRKAFLEGYERPVDFETIDCFLVLYRLCAINGVYMQSGRCDNDAWKQSALNDLKGILIRLDESMQLWTEKNTRCT